jgi:hypothetical protein
MFCTILSGGTPHRFYPSREAALKAAERHYRRTGEGVEIAWCRDGAPKVWVAYVTMLGVEFTDDMPPLTQVQP